MCKSCGETNFKELELDHINDDGYKDTDSKRKSLAFHLRKEGYPAGFQVLCSRCNKAKNARRIEREYGVGSLHWQMKVRTFVHEKGGVDAVLAELLNMKKDSKE